MRNSKLLPIVATTLVCVGAFVVSADASSNSQIVLSATGITTSVGPGGWWIWSQPGGTNAYGNAGAGNMYFYAHGIQRPVVVRDVVLSSATVSEDVASPDGSIVCHFSATELSRQVSAHGVNGLTSFSCSHPVGAFATNVPSTVIISNF